jgi:hypothetical protein
MKDNDENPPVLRDALPECAVYCVASPLQLVCATEARHEFKPRINLLVLILGHGKGKSLNNRQLELLLQDGYWNRVLVERQDGGPLERWMNQRRLIHATVNAVGSSPDLYFYGDYRSPLMHSLREALDPVDSYLMDDGISTLGLQIGYFAKGETRTRDVKGVSAPLSIVKGLLRWPYGKHWTPPAHKSPPPPNLFTFFRITPIQGNNQKVVNHDLTRLKTKGAYPKKAGDYAIVLGSPFVQSNQLTAEEALCLVRWTIEKHCVGLEPLYFPHRGESDQAVERLDAILDLKLARPVLPIELHLLGCASMPRKVIGFNSTALYLLRTLFGDIMSLVSIHIPIRRARRHTRNLETYQGELLRIEQSYGIQREVWE